MPWVISRSFSPPKADGWFSFAGISPVKTGCKHRQMKKIFLCALCVWFIVVKYFLIAVVNVT